MSAVAVGAAVAGAAVSSAFAPSPSGGGGGGAAAAADPFASQRPQYQTQLSNLMNGQFSTSDPSYAWRFGQGTDALNRTKASEGLLNSGNQSTALIDYGQNMASTEYGNQYARLSQLAGANVGSPAAAGQILYNQGQSQQAGATALGGTVTNAVGSWASDWGQSNSNPFNTPVDMTGFQTQPTSSGFFNQASSDPTYSMLPDTGMSSSWWASA